MEVNRITVGEVLTRHNSVEKFATGIERLGDSDKSFESTGKSLKKVGKRCGISGTGFWRQSHRQAVYWCGEKPLRLKNVETTFKSSGNTPSKL